MGSSKKQTIGYWYKYIWLDGWCWGPVDAVLEWRAGDRPAWQGRATANTVLTIDKKELWGGEKQEGGVVGDFEIMMGAADQMPNAWLEANLGGPQPGYRGILTTLWRGGKFGAFNPYPKSRALKVERILAGWPDDDPWYPAKAPVLLTAGGGGSGLGGNVWLALETLSNDIYLGEYGGTPWTLNVTTPTLVAWRDSARIGSYLYQFTNSGEFAYALASNPASWTLTAGVAVSGQAGQIANDDVNIYANCGGASKLCKMPLPFGTQTEIATAYNCNTVCVNNGKLFTNRNGYDELYKSSDAGASWSPCTSFYTSYSNNNIRISSSGTRLVAAYIENATPLVIDIRYSDDDGANWSAVVHSITIASGDNLFSNSLTYAADGFILVTENGLNAHSADGASWSNGAAIPKVVTGLARGIGKVVVGTKEANLYESTNSGGAWTQMPEVVSTSSDLYYCQVHWIGPESGEAPDPAAYAMNPAHMLYESIVLPPEMGGMGEPAGLINAASFEAAADKLFAEGFGLCTVVMGDETPEEFQQRILDIIGGSISQSRETGQYYLDLMRDDYDLGSLLILGDDDIKSFQWEPGNISSAVNQVQVEWFDPQAKENRITAPIQSAGAIQAVGGVIAETYTHREIPLESLALRVAAMKLQVRSLPLGRFEISCSRKPWRLRKGQFFRLQYLIEGFADVVCLALDIDYGDLKDGSIKIIAMQDVFGLPTASYVEPVAAVDVVGSTAPAPAENRLAFEVPYVELASTLSTADKAVLAVDTGFLGVVATPPNANSVNFALHTATGAEDYVERGTGDWCPSALIVEAANKVDTAFTLSGGSNLDRVAVGSWALWGAEIVRIDAIDPVLLTLTVGRGCADTVPATHAAAERIYFAGDWLAGDSREYVDAEVVRAKLLTRTVSGVLPISGTPNANVTMAHRQIRPYPPALLRFSDDLYTDLSWPIELAGAITTTWAHRDRLLQDDQLVDTTSASIGPEAGTTYDVRYYQPPGTLVNTESGVGGAAATAYTFPADGPAEITVEASRAGYTSWQLTLHSFDYYRYPRKTTVTGEPRITDDGSARKVI